MDSMSVSCQSRKARLGEVVISTDIVEFVKCLPYWRGGDTVFAIRRVMFHKPVAALEKVQGNFRCEHTNNHL